MVCMSRTRYERVGIIRAPPAVPKRPQGIKVRRDGTPEVTAARYVGVEQRMKELGFLGRRPPSRNVRKV